MQLFLEDPEKKMEEFSQEFEETYMRLLRLRGDNPVNANNLYQEMIADQTHVHMTATKWDSLTTFIRYLADTGKAEVTVEDGKYFIKYINRDADFLKRKEIEEKQRLAAQKSEKFTEAALQAQMNLALAEERSRLHEKGPDEVDVTNRTTKVSFSLAPKDITTLSHSTTTLVPAAETKSKEPMRAGITQRSASNEASNDQPPTVSAGSSSILTQPRPGPPGIKPKVPMGPTPWIANRPNVLAGKPGVLGKPTVAAQNVFDSNKGGTSIQAATTATPSSLGGSESSSIEGALELGTKRAASESANFTWMRQGLVVARLDSETETYIVSELLTSDHTQAKDLEQATFAKLKPIAETGEGASGKITILSAQDEDKFTTRIPATGQDVCLLSISAEDPESDPARSTLRKKLAVAVRACSHRIHADDLPKGVVESVVNTDSLRTVVVKFPGSVALSLRASDVCQFLERT